MQLNIKMFQIYSIKLIIIVNNLVDNLKENRV